MVENLLEKLTKYSAQVSALKDAEANRDATIREIFAYCKQIGRRAPRSKMAEITGFDDAGGRLYQIRDGR
jgi:hypothetical protein